MTVVLPPREAIHRELARRSLADFFRHSWHVLEPQGRPLVWNWHLQVICDHVQALFEGRLGKQNLLINVPPGSSKSRIVSVCATAWWWIEHPEWRGIFSSGNPRTVIRDSLYCRQLIESPWYQSWFRPTWRFLRDQNTKGQFNNTAGGFRLAMSSGAKVTGDRADGLFMDDMLDAPMADSKTAREEFKLWYNAGFANRVNDAERSIRCMIAQRLAEDDPAGHVLNSGEWEHLRIRQRFALEKGKTPQEPRRRAAPTSLGWVDPRTKVGALMDPVRFKLPYLAAELKRLGTRGFASQHQQDPSPAGGTIIKSAWLRAYHTPRRSDGGFRTPREICAALGITRIIQGWDTALSTKAAADFTAGLTLGVAENRYYVLDLFKEKVEAPDARRVIQQHHAKWAATAIAIEGGGSASGKAIAQELRRDTRLPIIELPNTIDKVTAMNLVAPTVEAGVIYVPDDQSWANDFTGSLTQFPAGEHDDDCDAFRIALGYAVTGGGGMGMFEWMRQEAARVAALRGAALSEAA